MVSLPHQIFVVVQEMYEHSVVFLDPCEVWRDIEPKRQLDRCAERYRRTVERDRHGADGIPRVSTAGPEEDERENEG